jgi:two-component system aerobic respiration control sensor histidine kinase ArcB
MSDIQRELEQLRAELAYYKKLVAIMPGHVYWVDRNNVFRGCNIAHARSAGLTSPDEFVGTTPYNHASQHYADIVCEVNNRIMTSGNLEILEEVGAFKDGIECTYLSHKLPIYDNDDKVVGLLGVSLDITKQKQLEQALTYAHEESKQNLELLANIIDLIPGHVYWLDRDNIIRGCNQQILNTLGLQNKAQMIGTTFYQHFSKQDANAIIAVNNRIMLTGKTEMLEEIGNYQGQTRNFLSKKTPMYNTEGEVIGLLGVSIDITNEKRLSQALQVSQKRIEEAEKTLENIIALLPGHVYWKDEEGRYLGCNELQAKAAGYENRADYIGKTDFADLSEEDAKKIRAADLKVMTSGQPLTIEETVTLPSKETHTFLSQKTPFRDADNKVKGILGVSIDITTQIQLRQELLATQAKAQQTENTLDNLISLLPALVYWKDRNGVYLGANKLEAIGAGYEDPKDLIGKTDYDMAWKAYAKDLIINDNEIMCSGVPQTFEEISVLSNDGTKRTFISNKAPLREADGQIIGIMGVSFDITDRKQLEQELYIAKQRAESALEHIIAIMPGHVYWEDKQGLILGCNDILAQNLGLISGQQLIGKTIYAYLPADEAAKQRAINRQVMDSGKPHTMEKSFIGPDGNEHTFLSQKTPLRDNSGQIFGLLDTSVDITERKQVEQAMRDAKEKAESANLAKTDFIASMSHDFRTPLNGIIGLAEILLLRIPQAEYKEFIQNILDCGKSIANLIENILNYAQIEAGRYELQNKPFDLRELLEHIILLVAPQARQKGVELLLKYQPQAPKLFRSDPLAISIILINLIGNALKFTDQGHIVVKISTEEVTKKQANINISIEDTGIGIPQDQLTKIFERFSRAEPSYISKYKGSGLGLAIVEKLVTSLNGSIKVDSEIGKGSAFTITLPLTIQNQIKTKSLNHLTKQQILIIDDNQFRANLLAEQLSPISCQVYSTKKALEQLAADQVINCNAAIVDIQTLAEEQLSLLKQLTDHFKQLCSPVIIATNNCSVEDKEQYQALGIEKILIKPLCPSQLDDLINLILAKATETPQD